MLFAVFFHLAVMWWWCSPTTPRHWHTSKNGGTRSSTLNAVAQTVLRLYEVSHIHLLPQFIPGKLNVLADSLSRWSQVIGSEWTLCSEAFSQLLRQWPATVDHFATALNHRLPVYFSPMVDPQSAGTDAMLQSWDGLQAYAFSPFSLISEVWPQHPWFPELLELLVAVPFSLPRRGICSDSPTFIIITRTSPCFS